MGNECVRVHVCACMYVHEHFAYELCFFQAAALCVFVGAMLVM